MKKIVGIDLGGTSIKFAILSQQGEILNKWSIKTNTSENGAYIISDMISSVKKHLAFHEISLNDILGIGIGSPGSIDYNKGAVSSAFNLGWKEKRFIVDEFSRTLDVKIYLDNDANCAALGEQFKGAGQKANNIIFITLGTGVGGGIINEGRIVHGKNGSAGEIGHLVVDLNGFLCSCGNSGCLETICSATGIVRIAKKVSKEVSIISSLIDDIDNITSEKIFKSEDDQFATLVIDKICFYLGLSCANLANILNPDFIILGGGVCAAGNKLLDRVKLNYNKFAFSSVRDSTQVILASLGNNAGLIGAGLLVLQNK